MTTKTYKDSVNYQIDRLAEILTNLGEWDDWFGAYHIGAAVGLASTPNYYEPGEDLGLIGRNNHEAIRWLKDRIAWRRSKRKRWERMSVSTHGHTWLISRTTAKRLSRE